MRKKNLMSMLRRSMFLFCAMCAVCSVTSCSSDGEDELTVDDSKFETPKYEAVAAKYEVSDASSLYKSVELTASGNFIIRLNQSQAGSSSSYSSTAGVKPRMLVNRDCAFSVAQTRAGVPEYTIWSDILYGTYTEIGESKYELAGYGVLTVTDEGGNAYSLHIERTTGESYDLAANKAGVPENGDNTNMLCRTWDISSYHYFVRINGKDYISLDAPTLTELQEKLIDWAMKYDPEYTEGDYEITLDPSMEPEQIVFSKSGTYMVLYQNSMLAVSTWKWENQSTGRLLYSWNPDSFDATNLSGRVDVEFSDSQLRITEGESESEDGYSFEAGITIIAKEAATK